MSGITNINRKTVRRQETIDEIVAMAWELSRVHGLGNFSMRQLGERVGMRAQSPYSYFASKNELFDAMFAAGNRAFLEHIQVHDDGGDEGGDPLRAIERETRRFFHFCVSDPVRYQLLFQRTIPDFVPSAESFAIAERAYEVGLAPLRDVGIDGPDLDLVTAVMSGLVAQQLANDPGGDRWERLVDRAVRMLLNELAPDLASSSEPRSEP